MTDTPWPNDAASLVDAIEDRFHRRHEELYTYAARDQEVVFVNARVAAVGEVSQRGQDTRPTPSAAACSPRATRQAWFGQWREVPVYALDDLRPGHTLAGPAIIGPVSSWTSLGTALWLTAAAMAFAAVAAPVVRPARPPGPAESGFPSASGELGQTGAPHGS